MPNTVLIVDSSPLQRRITEVIVNTRLYGKAFLAETYHAALEMLKAPPLPIDLVVLDLALPKMQGFAILREIRAWYPELPVLAVIADAASAVESMDLGATDFVEKQSAPERLQASIQNMLKLCTLQREVNRLSRTLYGRLPNDAAANPTSGSGLSLLNESGHCRSLIELENDIIRFALNHYHRHISEVARRLGIGRSTLYRKLAELGITEPGRASRSHQIPPAFQQHQASG